MLVLQTLMSAVMLICTNVVVMPSVGTKSDHMIVSAMLDSNYTATTDPAYVRQ